MAFPASCRWTSFLPASRLQAAAFVAALALATPFATTAEAQVGVIATIAGTGTSGFAGDGGPAASAELSFPTGAVAAPDGGVLIADMGNNAVREMFVDGTILTVAGIAGSGGFGGDGGKATAARLNQPTGVSPLPGGGFLIADSGNNRVRMVSASGVITTVAGTGVKCAFPAQSCGDGGTAVTAQLNAPEGVAVLPTGGFLIAEAQGHKIRAVAASGKISRVAGVGLACATPTSACGDGGSALAARFNTPIGVAVTSDGGFVVSDSKDNRIRKVSPIGVISTLAGNGIAGSFGNGIKATQANLNSPSGVAVAPNGVIVIADTFSHLVRVVSGGLIHTLAGIADDRCPNSTNTCGDGGKATAAQLDDPFGVGVTPDGMALIADNLDHRIRRVDAGLGGEPTVRVQDDAIVDGAGQKVQLRGVDRAIFESRCTFDSNGIADGPFDQASVSAMVAWKPDAIRVMVNEDCWLGINGLPLDGDAPAYRAAVVSYVNLLRRNHLYVMLAPGMSAPGTNKSTRIDYMPDNDHMPTFWRSVASTFRANHGVIFDPINEVAMATWNNPHPVPAGQWNCWLKGCTLDSLYGGRFQGVGLQTLVNVIRSTGATQPILLGGIDFNSDFTQLLTSLPSDPQNQLIASAHVYDFAEGSGTDALFSSQLVPITKRIPVILGELGERNCDSGKAAYSQHVLSLIDGEAAKGVLIGMLAFTWNARTSVSTGWGCPTTANGQGGPLVIRDYTGAPTISGAVFRSWILSKAGNP